MRECNLLCYVSAKMLTRHSLTATQLYIGPNVLIKTKSLIIRNSNLILPRCHAQLTRTLNNTLNTIKTHLQHIHLRPVAQTDKVVTWAVEEITTLRRVQVKEDTRNNNDLLTQQGVKEVQAIGDVSLRRQGRVERSQIKPDIESSTRDVLDTEADIVETSQDVVALLHEVALQRLHLGAHERGLQHRDRGFLERHVGAAVEV